ncbi:alpha/beta fold hydrolase [Clostridium sardiniense]|uniref:alpha/beta fold hydrolase n=1 Tax=Clostridium sardiniense TaxID=29369 RepID=UPI003D32DCA5
MYYQKVGKDVKIAVNDVNPSGNPTVLFIHGWPLTSEVFEYQYNILPKYNIRCISIDIRGFGKSDKPFEGYSYDDLADDLYKIIKNIDVKSLILAGFSMGGAIAIRYMARHKGYKVSKLALLGAAAPSFTKYPGYPYGTSKEDVDAIIKVIYKDRPKAINDFGKNFFASNISEEFRSWFLRVSLKSTGYATIKTAISLRDENMFDDLKCIKVPTGIFHGMLDEICPFEFALELNKNIHGSTLYAFEESGHGLFYDQLDEFNKRLIKFICK